MGQRNHKTHRESVPYLKAKARRSANQLHAQLPRVKPRTGPSRRHNVFHARRKRAIRDTRRLLAEEGESRRIEADRQRALEALKRSGGKP